MYNKNLTGKVYEKLKEGHFRALSIAFDDVYYNNLKSLAVRLQNQYKKIFVIGMGGSFLGAKTIIEALKLCKVEVCFLYFIEDELLEEQISKITNQDLVLTISKSGNTTETLYILEKIIAKGIRNGLSITENENGELAKISKNNSFEVLKHEPVCGRFSFLTNVAILPCLIAGLNLESFLSGVKKAINEIFVSQNEEFDKFLELQMLDKALNLNILMPYSIKMQSLTYWFSQLYAESLNKDGFKIMPFPSIGTRDQHSVLEGYLQNPKDKMITFIIKKETNLLYKEYLLTKKICEEQGLKVRAFEFERITEEELGFIMSYLVIEVLCIAEGLRIDPFNQEMVEKRKKLKVL